MRLKINHMISSRAQHKVFKKFSFSLKNEIKRLKAVCFGGLYLRSLAILEEKDPVDGAWTVDRGRAFHSRMVLGRKVLSLYFVLDVTLSYISVCPLLPDLSFSLIILLNLT